MFLSTLHENPNKFSRLFPSCMAGDAVEKQSMVNRLLDYQIIVNIDVVGDVRGWTCIFLSRSGEDRHRCRGIANRIAMIRPSDQLSGR